MVYLNAMVTNAQSTLGPQRAGIRAAQTVAVLTASLAAADDTAAPPPYEAVQALVQTHCIGCHSTRRPKGGLDLEQFQNEDHVIEAFATWMRVERRVMAGEMPPRGKDPIPEPDLEMLRLWFASIKDASKNCDRLVSEASIDWYPGFVMSRRLNRFEYERTVRDLLHVNVDVAEMFPADGAGGEGFTTDGGALFLSAIQMEKYLEAATYAVRTAFADDAARAQLLPVRPTADISARDAAYACLRPFIARAWRKRVRPSAWKPLAELALAATDRGEPFDEAMQLGYIAALVSPNFLFLAEPKPDEKGVYPLGDYELASRLSYFLWATMPDDELFAAARARTLSTEAGLLEQLHRMLEDPKAAGLGEQFAAQWLGVDQLGETRALDMDRFPEFTPELVDAMQAEPAHLFHAIVAENRSVLELIDADYTYANGPLADLYGAEANDEPGMQRIQLADARRGGVLGMAGVLAVTSQPLRTSPVLRGKWVLEQILGEGVPPPPPGAGTLPEDDKPVDGLSLRARMEQHRADPTCAACHARMDPLGFGLENFDPIGRWRDDLHGEAIDASGELPSGETFDGPVELKRMLLERKDAFARHLSRKLFGYALGRGLTMHDECVLDRSVQALRDNEYRVRPMLEQIVISYPFRHRYSSDGD